MLGSILENVNVSMSITDFVVCTIASILLGLIFAIVYKTVVKVHSQNFVISLVLLPIVVQIVIMLVNGNLGTGVAVMGAFTLVRFRSLPGTAKEICAIFCSMVIGLATGMGYLTVAVIVTIIIALLIIILEKINFGLSDESEKQLKIVIPDNLDYEEVFDEILKKYTTGAELIRVKTTNLGAMYELTYQVKIKKDTSEKAFIDELRCRNGNLTITLGRKPMAGNTEL